MVEENFKIRISATLQNGLIYGHIYMKNESYIKFQPILDCDLKTMYK